MSKVGRKRRVDWRELIFSLHWRELSEAYQLFKNAHPSMSINRCAYNVLKSFYSTTTMAYFRNQIEHSDLSYDEVVQWYHFDRQVGAIHG